MEKKNKGSDRMKRMGIVCAAQGEMFSLRRDYVEMLRYFGVEGVLLPVSGIKRLQGLDGILLPGGGDVDSVFLGKERIPELRNVDRKRDAFEFSLCHLALAEGLAVLGICRGMQLCNVALGGSLNQHLREPRLSHHDETDHWVKAAPAYLAVTKAERFWVNSAHHQAVERPAPGLETVLWAEDGVVEGVKGGPLGNWLGLQFHPERMYRNSETVQRILADFFAKL